MILTDRYFVPVCLYPHTKYRTAVGVATLFEKYILSSREYLIIVADRLLVLDRLVTGRYFTVNSAISKARKEAKQIVSLIRRIAQKVGANATGKVVYWDDVAGTAEFSEFASRLRGAVLTDVFLAQAIEEFIDRRVKRFGLGSDPDREREYERDYLLSEVCMSVYCTEILGFCNEVWERPPAPDIPDPLKLLYEHRPQLVTRVTTRPAVRTLHFLYTEGHRSADHMHNETLTQG
jgi:hypothetical protein